MKRQAAKPAGRVKWCSKPIFDARNAVVEAARAWAQPKKVGALLILVLGADSNLRVAVEKLEALEEAGEAL